MAANHDININQGDTLNLHILYTDSDDSGINLDDYTAEMKVKRSFQGNDLVLHITGSTGGSTAWGPYGVTAGITGSADSTGISYAGLTGGIVLNRNVGNSGSQTGGILIIAGSTATSHVPNGIHFYSLDVKYKPTGANTRLLDGRFECNKDSK
tara:strand:+ start:92 stop:550 length:459 start_codon:yes stop_codon:yes gene_type:complete